MSRFEVDAPRLAVGLLATSRAIAALHRHGYAAEPVESPARGKVRATATFDDMDAAVRELMPLGGAVEVLGPPELRDRVRDAAGEIVAVYS